MEARQAGSLSHEDILADAELRAACATELVNLSATLGDLANALGDAGATDEALQTAEQGIAIDQALDNKREAAAGLIQTAQILMRQGRYAEADARYEQALAAARAAGDTELEASILQHHGGLAQNCRQYDQASERYKRALKLFQQAGNDEGVMQTCNLLGLVERNQGRLSEARAWYQRSREIATERKDNVAVSIAAQNLGVVCQLEGKAARKEGDSAAADQHFAAAERHLLESLDVWRETNNEPNEAASEGQLGQLYLLMNRLDDAEQHAQRARQIEERLCDLRGLSTTYMFLKNIALARDDAAAAAKWAERERQVDEELARRARGGDDADGMEANMEQMLASLTVACVQAALGTALPREADEILKQMDDPNAGPLQPLAAWLRQIAAANEQSLPPLLNAPPAELPDGVRMVLQQIQAQL